MSLSVTGLDGGGLVAQPVVMSIAALRTNLFAFATQETSGGAASSFAKSFGRVPAAANDNHAGRILAIDAAAVPNKTYAVHVDHLHRGYPARRSQQRRRALITGATKTTVWSAAYEPFGRASSISGPATQNLGLPGHAVLMLEGQHK